MLNKLTGPAASDAAARLAVAGLTLEQREVLRLSTMGVHNIARELPAALRDGSFSVSGVIKELSGRLGGAGPQRRAFIFGLAQTKLPDNWVSMIRALPWRAARMLPLLCSDLAASQMAAASGLQRPAMKKDIAGLMRALGVDGPVEAACLLGSAYSQGDPFPLPPARRLEEVLNLRIQFDGLGTPELRRVVSLAALDCDREIIAERTGFDEDLIKEGIALWKTQFADRLFTFLRMILGRYGGAAQLFTDEFLPAGAAARFNDLPTLQALIGIWLSYNGSDAEISEALGFKSAADLEPEIVSAMSRIGAPSRREFAMVAMLGFQPPAILLPGS